MAAWVYGSRVPEAYGGAGWTRSPCAGAGGDLQADASHGVIISVNNSLYCHGIMKFGTEEQKKKYVTPIASGTGDRRIFIDRTSKRLRRREHAILAARRRLVYSERPQNRGDEWAGGRPSITFFMMTDPKRKQSGVSRLSCRPIRGFDSWKEGTEHLESVLLRRVS